MFMIRHEGYMQLFFLSKGEHAGLEGEALLSALNLKVDVNHHRLLWVHATVRDFNLVYDLVDLTQPLTYAHIIKDIKPKFDEILKKYHRLDQKNLYESVFYFVDTTKAFKIDFDGCVFELQEVGTSKLYDQLLKAALDRFEDDPFAIKVQNILNVLTRSMKRPTQSFVHYDTKSHHVTAWVGRA